MEKRQYDLEKMVYEMNDRFVNMKSVYSRDMISLMLAIGEALVLIEKRLSKEGK